MFVSGKVFHMFVSKKSFLEMLLSQAALTDFCLISPGTSVVDWTGSYIHQ